MDASSSNVQVVLCATLSGHKDTVTSIAAPADPTKKFIVSGSRDKTAIVWELPANRENFGFAKKSLHGHNHFISEVAITPDGGHVLTASWDKTLRLWNVATGKTEARLLGHTHDVLSCAISPDTRLIVSASRDKTIKLWNTMGQYMGDFATSSGGSRPALAGHTEWVSCVRFSPDITHPLVVSTGWDKVVKVWDLKSGHPVLNVNHIGHSGYVNTNAISPDGTLCASAGKDGTVMLWDLHDPKHLYSLDAGDIIHCLIFSPNRYWLCAATETSIKIWDLLSKTIVDDLRPEFPPTKSGKTPYCVSLAWAADGSTLYSGYTDGNIRVWQVTQRSA